MRFGDGAWSMLPGVVPTYLTRVDAMEVRDREVVMHVSSRAETARGATLEGHMFTVRITSPMQRTMRIQVTHHKGRRKRYPEFQLHTDPVPLEVSEAADRVTIRSGRLDLVVRKQPWCLEFVDSGTGEVVTTSPFQAQGLMEKPGEGVFLREQLTLSVGELVYGLGERFSAFAKNGQSIDMWNSDCGTCSDKSYKNVPFFLTSRGYGVLVNTPARVSFEMGTEQVMRAQFSVPGEDLDYFLMLGPTPKEVLERLGALSGRPALPPAWSFGLWLSTSFLTDYDEPTVMGQIDEMSKRGIPLHVLHFDCFWMKAHHWCNFRWDERSFPDPKGMIHRLHERGLHVCVWINPYVGERSHLFEEGAERGYLLKRPNGDVYQRHKWQAGMAYVDFTNPAATRWYQAQLRRLLEMGVDCFKTDFGEEIPTDAVYCDGSDPELMHNYYTYLYNRAVFDLLVEVRGQGDATVFARSATATCQSFPVHWGGDCYGTYESMAESLRGGLSLTASGFGFWSHDIGGFENAAPANVYKRWVPFGLLSSHSRLHGSTSYRVPWLYDEEAVDVLRAFTRLKCQLSPYLMAAALEAHEVSAPVMRAMWLEFPNDPACRTLDRQYMLGAGLLVAPVFHDKRAEYYLPDGEWTHLLTGQTRSGGRWVFEDLGFLDIPVWIRPNTLLPMGASLEKVDYDFAHDVRLVCGSLDGATPCSAQMIDARGNPIVRFGLRQSGNRVTLTNSEGRRDFRIHLPWANDVTELSGAEMEARPPSAECAPGNPGGVVLAARASSVSFVWRA